MKIVGLAGQKHSGKDTCADFFVSGEKFKKVALATPLKEMLSSVFDVELKYFNDEILKEAELPHFITIQYHHIHKIERQLEEWGFTVDYVVQHAFVDFVGETVKTPRVLMQLIGTDMLRKHVRDDLWIVLLFDKIKELSCDVVVSDVRLKNEREALKKAGAKLMLIKRNNFKDGLKKDDGINPDKHISENDLGKDEEYDAVIKNDNISLGQLRSEVLMWWNVAGVK